MRFGMMQSKIGIVKILLNYELSLCDKSTVPMVFHPAQAFLAPIDGMWLNVKKIGY